MSNAKKIAFAVIAAATLTVAACTDRPDGGMPTAPKLVRDANGMVVMGTCVAIGDLNTLAAILFAPNAPNVNSVLGKLDNLNKKVLAGNVADAQAQAQNIVEFVRAKAAQGVLAGTPAQIASFISGTLCFAGLSPDTHLILPTDQEQTIVSTDGQAGIQLPAGPVGTPTLLTIRTLDPGGPSPLITKLDQYPAYVDFTVSSPVVGTAVVAVCPAVTVPSDVRGRLRLGHQASNGFELTPHADGSFLPCTTPASLTQSRVPGWLRKVASLIVPKPLYAQFEAERGGIGGSVTELSPFDAVDPELSLRGGIGGSVTELIRRSTDTTAKFGPATQGTTGASGQTTGARVFNGDRALAVLAGTCTEVSATVGTALEPECRPMITVTTHNGTIMNNVPVNWAVTAGGGTIAPDTISSQTCGNFATTAATLSDALGKAAICWILGPNGGTNKSTATPTVGGDAPAGVTFSPAVFYFSAEGLKITPTAGATGGSFPYDALPHAGSGTCSNSLTPVLTYSGGAAPTDVGSYTLTVTCGAGSTVYNTATATATITISAVTPEIAFSCPASVVYDGTAQQPCTATASAVGGLNAPASLSYSNNTNVGTANVSASFAATGNYGTATATTTFTITPAATTTTVTCDPASLTYTGSPLTPCAATTTGAGGLNVATTVDYTGNTNVGTAHATATYAGDANHSGSSGTGGFTIGKAGSTVTVSCTGTATYTGSAVTPSPACTALATGAGGLNASVSPITYSNNVNVGSGTASATWAGDDNHTGNAGTATFAIGKATTVTTLTCPATVTYTGSAQSPCSANVTGTNLSQSVPVTYSPSPAVVGPITANATYPGGTSWLASSSAPKTFSILYVQSGCFASPIYNVMPDTKSAQKKGSNLPVKCTLLTAQGTGVTNATGSLTIADVGTTYVQGGVTTGPLVALPNGGVNLFKLSTGGNYAYGVDTSAPGFIAGHYYYVTATWSDGSKTTGWFLLK